MYGSFVFVRNPVNALKKISPLKFGNPTKFTAFIAFNAKKRGHFAMKKDFVVDSKSPLILHNFSVKPRPGFFSRGSKSNLQNSSTAI